MVELGPRPDHADEGFLVMHCMNFLAVTVIWFIGNPLAISAFRLVNSIESVAKSQPGWRFFRELIRLGGRFAINEAASAIHS
jgi:hypothetical protein